MMLTICELILLGLLVALQNQAITDTPAKPWQDNHVVSQHSATDPIMLYKKQLMKEIGLLKPLYPEQAKNEKREGIVILKFNLHTDGKISNIVIYKSSGHDDIDHAAVNMLKQLKNLDKPPKGFPSKLTVPVKFLLNPGF